MEDKKDVEKRKISESTINEQTGKKLDYDSEKKCRKSSGNRETGEYATDEQTGKTYAIERERVVDIIAAVFSILYLIGMLLVFCWLIIDMFLGKNELLNLLVKAVGPKESEYLNVQIFQLIAFSVIGGGMGGVINGIRGFVIWHAERRAFGWRFFWKYLTLPLVGMLLAAMVYAIVRGGVAVYAGEVGLSNGDITTQGLSAFALGALTGYGSQKVFVWLDKQANKLFKAPVEEVKVPDLTGKTQDEAENLLKELGLKLGKVEKKPCEETTEIGKVIAQKPPAGSMISEGTSIHITIAVGVNVSQPGETTKPQNS